MNKYKKMRFRFNKLFDLSALKIYMFLFSSEILLELKRTYIWNTCLVYDTKSHWVYIMFFVCLNKKMNSEYEAENSELHNFKVK
jgi:hypothetical protein